MLTQHTHARTRTRYYVHCTTTVIVVYKVKHSINTFFFTFYFYLFHCCRSLFNYFLFTRSAHLHDRRCTTQFNYCQRCATRPSWREILIMLWNIISQRYWIVSEKKSFFDNVVVGAVPRRVESVFGLYYTTYLRVNHSGVYSLPACHLIRFHRNPLTNVPPFAFRYTRPSWSADGGDPCHVANTRLLPAIRSLRRFAPNARGK